MDSPIAMDHSKQAILCIVVGRKSIVSLLRLRQRYGGVLCADSVASGPIQLIDEEGEVEGDLLEVVITPGGARMTGAEVGREYNFLFGA
jgi:hypothetical protein